MKQVKYKKAKRCRYCDTPHYWFEDILDLGKMYPSDFVEENAKKNKIPLKLVKCPVCDLVQLSHTADREKLYRQYWYRSGLNSSMVKALGDIAFKIENHIEKNPANLVSHVVVDIGCNDGTMLKQINRFSFPEVIRVGFDPAKNLAEEAKGNMEIFVNDFFSETEYSRLALPKASVVTAIAMFYDLENIYRFVKEVYNILEDKGIFIIQLTDLTTTLKINAIDNICHEHLEYYSLNFLFRMAREIGFSIGMVSHNEVNGGSLRVTFEKLPTLSVSKSVMQEIVLEHQYYEQDCLESLQERVETIKEIVVRYIETSKEAGNTLAIMGASTKGNTLLQYFGIDNKLIDHAAEVNPEKFGLRTIGTDIPIISEEESLKKNPDCYLVLPWHFIDNFVERNVDYLLGGGSFLTPLPTPMIYYQHEGRIIKHELS